MSPADRRSQGGPVTPEGHVRIGALFQQLLHLPVPPATRRVEEPDIQVQRIIQGARRRG